MLLTIDFSIPDSLTGMSPNQLVQGLGRNRTTFCHWLQTDIVQNDDGTLTSDTKPIAAYRKLQPDT